MSATNEDTSNNTHSSATFVSALVTGLVTFTVYTILFWFLHSRFQRVYQPRTLLAPESKRPKVLPTSFIGWFRGLFSEPDIRAGEFNGPDAYFFLRFIKFLSILLIPYWLISWPVLMTVSAIKPNKGQKGIDQFSYGNIDNDHQIRHVAHLAVALVLIGWTLFMLHREYASFLRIRQAYLNSPAHGALARSRTVMINNLPKDWINSDRVRELAAFTNGHVEAVWLPRKVDAMEKLFDARNKECLKLEAAETKAMVLAAKNVEKKKLPAQDAERHAEDASPLLKYIREKDLPTHRRGPLGLFGKKVNTLEDSPPFIRKTEEELEAERAKLDEQPLLNSAFIRFSKQADAHMFAKMIKSQPGAKLVGAAVDVVPEDIIWNNLSMSPFMRKIRTIISWALTIGLIIIWSIPVAFVGSVSKISTLCNKLKFLSWICTLPDAVVGIIQGILPPVLFGILFALLPIVLRIFVKLQGEPRSSDVERKLWSRFWLFQVVHGLLIVGFASGLIPAVEKFDETAGQLPTILATSLPTSSTYFLTFILTNTLTAAASTNSRVVPVVLSKLAFIFRGKTPRKAFDYDYKMGAIKLATTWPPVALLGCIAIVYTPIQPLVPGFAVVGLFLLYIVYKYLLIWVMDQPDHLETGGLYYPRALRAIFVSLYIMELCMTGLFFLTRNSDNSGISKVGLGCGVVMAVTVAATIAYEVWLEFTYSRKYKYLDTTVHPVGNASAEALWPRLAQGGQAAQEQGTMNLDADLIAQESAANGMGEQYGNTTGLHHHAFDNPAAWKDQPIVWIPDDTLGLGRSEVERMGTQKVKSSCEYTTMDDKGRVDVQRGPPDEQWYMGGKTAA